LNDAADLQAVYARAARMVGRPIADEFILVPLVGHGAEVDAIFSLNGVAAFIWKQLDGTKNGVAIVKALVARYEVKPDQADADYRGFVVKLLSINAITRVEAVPAP